MGRRDGDPLHDARYIRKRAAWLAGYAGQPHPCHHCGRPVDTTLPGTAQWGPTVEHTTPIRDIVAMARDYDDALAMALDTSRWALSHRRCNVLAGARVGGRMARKRRVRTDDLGASRKW